MESHFGIANVWVQGDFVTRAVALLLIGMSVASWIVIIIKALDILRFRKHARQARDFWHSEDFAAGLTKLGADPANPFRQLAMEGREDFRDLPLVTIDPAGPPDFIAFRAALAEAVPQAILDDHRTWVDRLIAMANTTVTIGMSVLALMLAATVLSVVFATRGAMAGNGHIIEVLHFVGAEAGFIAGEFRRHFLLTGMKGAAAGGAAAMAVFIAFSWWSSRNMATPEADQATALFGNFAIGSSGYAGVALIVLVVGALTAATSHLTVVSYLGDIDTTRRDG